MDTLKPPLRHTEIDGAILEPLLVIDTNGGPVLRMLRKNSPMLPDFPNGIGEIYFSEVLPGAVKAWKRHNRQNQYFAVPSGELKIVLFDGRPESGTFQKLIELALGRPRNYSLLRIPAGVWYGFAAMHNQAALICNCADMVHDPAECDRLPLLNDIIPYSW